MPESGLAPTDLARRRVARALFATLLGVYAYFFQGGGWNQNSRWAQIRSVVEQRSLSINDYLVYRHRGRRQSLERSPIVPGTPWRDVADRASSADVLEVAGTGLIFPNKPPGTVLLAAPFYAAILTGERMLGADPDTWRVMTLNAHLVTLLSAGVAGALTAVVLLRASSALCPSLPLATHAAAALTCGLGTLLLPYSTVLFDHSLAALFPLLAFCLVVEPPSPRRAGLAGLAAGIGLLTNYLTATIAGLLGVYLLSQRRWRDSARYAAGLLPPLSVLAIYQLVCFGSPWALAKALPLPIVEQGGSGLFTGPDPVVLWELLAGAHRGLLVSSPVLALAAPGLVWIWRAGRRAEATLAAAVSIGFWLLIGGFGPGASYWQGGWSIGPRYLVPAIPFLALGLAPAFARLPRITTLLAIVSALVLLLATAVDVQPPRRARRPLPDYVWPLWQGKTLSLADAELRGPVSVNPVGVYEGGYHKLFPPTSRVPAWNSYNLGELLWPASRLSLLPLLAWIVGGVALTLSRARSVPGGGATR
jgi:hypothetical protein